MHKICGQCSGGRFGFAPSGLDPIPYACPEGRLVDVQLVSEDVGPDARPVGVPVHRVGDPRPQDPAIMKVKLVGDVMRAGPAACVAYRLPSLGLAERPVVLACWRGPGHRDDPTSHSRNWSSSLKLIS